MKRQIILCFLFGLFIFCSCKKEIISTEGFKVSNPFYDSSIEFLKSNLSGEDFARLDLNNFEELKYHDKVLGFKIFEQNMSHDQFLILGKTANEYNGNWVDMSALKMIQSSNYKSGSISLKSLDGKSSTKIIVEKNKVADVIKQGDNSTLPDNVSPVLPEIIIYLEIGKGDDNSGGGASFTSLYWLFNQNYAYSGYYYQDPGNSGSGHSTSGNSGHNVSAAPEFISPDNPIADLRKEVECFTNSNASTYTISLNVNQPFPNSRDIMNVFATFPVGHSFLTLDQVNADGSHTIRNVGFYPKNQVKFGTTIDQSTFGEDSNTPFDVSLKFDVSGSEFMTVINKLVGEQSSSYDLDNFNCTDAMISALSSININLPSTKSTDLLFNGNDPADLGEDLRNLDLNQFSKDNGNRKITRSVSNFNNQKPPAKKGYLLKTKILNYPLCKKQHSYF